MFITYKAEVGFISHCQTPHNVSSWAYIKNKFLFRSIVLLHIRVIIISKVEINKIQYANKKSTMYYWF